MTAPSVTAEQLNEGMAHLIPVAHNMGVRFTELERGFAKSSIPFDGNGNHFGVMYAGALYTVAEVLGGAVCFATFDGTKFYPLVRKMTIEFLAPAKGPVTAEARISEEQIAEIQAAADKAGKAPFVLTTQIFAEDGTLVGTTSGDYQLRAHDMSAYR